MMAYNVTAAYGTSRFSPIWHLLAPKSGTAEGGGGQAPHAWFTGFLRDEDHPYAFLVLVENGGSGSSAAGDVASRVLNALVSPDLPVRQRPFPAGRIFFPLPVAFVMPIWYS